MPLSPEQVHRRLHEAARSFRWSRATRWLAAGAVVSLGCLIVFLLGDAQFHVGAAARWVGFLCVISPLAAGAACALPAWLRPVPELVIARRIEAACPGAGNALINAVQFDRELPAGSAMRAAVFNELADPFPRVYWPAVFDLQRLIRLGLALAAAAAVVLLWGMLRPAAFANSVSRVLLPARSIAPLTRTRLRLLTPGNANVAHGGSLDVSAYFGGELPATARIHYRFVGGGWQRALMNREVGTEAFLFHWQNVSEPLEYSVEAGDLATPVYTVAVHARTAVSRRRAEIRPPAYTGLPARTVSGFHALDGVVPGSDVRFTLDFNNPVESLSVAGNDGAAHVARTGDKQWTVALPVRANRTVALDVCGGEDAAGKETLSVLTTPDEPPKINVTAPVEGRELAAIATAALPIEFTATDDYGLASVGLYRSTDEKPDAHLIQEWAVDGRKSFTGRASIPLEKYAKPGDKQLTFCLVARDRNDVTGPGVTVSRPLRVALDTPDSARQRQAGATAKLEQSLRDLLKLQQTNLDATHTAAAVPATALTDLLDRQVAVGDLAGTLVGSADDIAPDVRGTLRALVGKEMPAAVSTLRDAAGAAAARPTLLGTAARLETVILARLRGLPEIADAEARREPVENLIAGVDGLLHEQRAILKETGGAVTAAAAAQLSTRQDALAEQAVRVRKEVANDAGNSSVGDASLRAGLTKIVAMFGEFKIYEQMLTAADALGTNALPKAAGTETAVVTDLQKMVNILSRWELAQAGARADEMRKTAEEMKAKLTKLAELQREVIEKSKERARKDQVAKDDENTAAEIVRTKDVMGKTVEGMLTDANVFPDMIISNELKAQLSSIFEDVKQDDLDAIAKNKLKPQDAPVQKEDALLKAIEETKKIPEDMEMFLPNTSNTVNNLDENFDNTEIPKLDNLPLPDELTDIVGELQKEQEDLAAKVQGAASNQVLKAMQQGGPISDGPQSGYSAQGKSGNQKPMDFEQGGRSAGGREGESNGEMVGKTADSLEGREAKVRRTSDPMQSGNVDDPSGKAADAKATGGGKASGFSNREGMDGDAPLRASRAPHQAADDALAAAQAQLAQKTSQKAAQASLLFLHANRLQVVAGSMQESQAALREGRMADFEGLHRKILAQLRDAQGQLATGQTGSLATGEAARVDGRQSLGGGEGEAPAPYKDRVADYYRSLANGQ